MATENKTLVISVKGDMYERYAKYAEENGDNVKVMISRAMKYYMGTLESRERRAEKQRRGESR